TPTLAIYSYTPTTHHVLPLLPLSPHPLPPRIRYFFQIIRPPPKSTLFPYTTLFRSLLRLVAFLLFLNPQCLASISRWITASSSWKRFCLFVCRALSSIMVICMLTAIRLLLTFVMSLYLLLRS